MSNSAMPEQVAGALREAETVWLFPHILMDGDAFGSAVALCRGLRFLGKQAEILLEDTIPANLRFLEKDYCVTESALSVVPDVCIAVDCSDAGRFPARQEHFSRGKLRINIDHHGTNDGFADLNYVDAEAAAVGEMVYRLLLLLGCPIDKETGEALYAAIATDTGNYQYSNTSKESHLITAALYDSGMDQGMVNREIYQSDSPAKVRMHARAIGDMELFCGGRGTVAVVSLSLLEETGALMEDTEGIVESLRNLNGVEISCLLKEHGNNIVKVSLRSKSTGNVAEISQKFGGGGHIRAAGCTLNGTLNEVKEQMKKVIAEELEK